MSRWPLYILIPLLIGCSDSKMEFEGVSDYLAWNRNADYGLVKIKEINGFKVSARYLHPEYLALKECRIPSPAEYDSLLALYHDTYTFLLNIGPDHLSSGDVMSASVSNYDEYQQLFHILNFQMDQLITLSSGNVENPPLNFSMENTYGLTDDRNIYLVFTREESSLEAPVTLSFNAAIFGLGICNFQFDPEPLNHSINFRILNKTDKDHEAELET